MTTPIYVVDPRDFLKINWLHEIDEHMDGPKQTVPRL